MEQQGWVKLHRNILEWEWYKDTHTAHLFIHLLISANHEPKRWQGITINRGQVISGRKALSQATGIPEQSIRTSLAKLKSTNELTIKSTSKYSIYTIVNYDKYQSKENISTSKSTNELTSGQPATNQQLTTNKNEKNEDNEKKDDGVSGSDFGKMSLKLQYAIKAPLPLNTAKLRAWLNGGWDFEQDILPTIENVIAKLEAKGEPPPNSLNYFENSIAKAYRDRTNPITVITGGKQQQDDEDKKWEAWINK